MMMRGYSFEHGISLSFRIFFILVHVPKLILRFTWQWKENENKQGSAHKTHIYNKEMETETEQKKIIIKTPKHLYLPSSVCTSYTRFECDH